MAEAGDLYFESPPVEEVALSAHYQPSPEFQSLSLGIFWDQLRAEYPRVEEHPVQPAIIEDLSGLPKATPRMLFLGTGVPDRMFRFKSADGSRLVQAQRDSIGVNWLRQSSEDVYPRYDDVRGQFERALEALAHVSERLAMPALRLLQVEVAYVNAVPVGEPPFDVLRSILLPWSGEFGNEIPSAESAAVTTTHRIDRGRLHLGANPWHRPRDGKLCFMLTVTSHVQPLDGQNVLPCMDEAHDWARRGFVAMTTAEAQTAWRRVR